MSFRNRLTSFFLLIVLLPMLAVGLLVFRLISDSGTAKAESRANGLVTAAASVYTADETASTQAAASVARAAASLPPSELGPRVRAVASQAGLVRVVITRNGRTIVDVGNRTAIAPGSARYVLGKASYEVIVSTTTASQFAANFAGSASGLVIRQGGRTLASSVPGAGRVNLPAQGKVTIRGASYEALTTGRALRGFGAAPVEVAALSDLRATSGSLSSSRLIAAVVIIGFLLLAISFAILASRGLESQLGRFLSAARSLASGDFSAPVPVEGSDEFAMLAVEFNNMSQQLARRLEELQAERVRLRESIRRAGETLASNLDRQSLLNLALKTAVDGVEGEFGRLSTRPHPEAPLAEAAREQSLEGMAEPVLEAERGVLDGHGLSEATLDDAHIASVPLGQVSADGRVLGVLTVGRRGRSFTEDDKELLRSLAGQATLAIENIELHHEVQLQAVTDELTGLANHGRFQELLGSEMDQVRRYHYPVGLIMLDLDNFKRVNDTYGHPQGDRVLKQVAHVLQETSREADHAARYGGEELALVLPHTDLEGSYAIAERIRVAIEGLRVPMVDGSGFLQVTASLGVGVTADGDKDQLIGETDAALYRAKHGGKNRTERAASVNANVNGGG
jgi:diguanylate cyclase (GGDEF)-like protein